MVTYYEDVIAITPLTENIPRVAADGLCGLAQESDGAAYIQHKNSTQPLIKFLNSLNEALVNLSLLKPCKLDSLSLSHSYPCRLSCHKSEQTASVLRNRMVSLSSLTCSNSSATGNSSSPL